MQWINWESADQVLVILLNREMHVLSRHAEGRQEEEEADAEKQARKTW